MKKLLFILVVFFANQALAQHREWHVIAADAAGNNFSTVGDGSYERPWRLQNALNNPAGVIKPGDTIWLHGGTYAGQFSTNLTGNAANYITVASYPGEWARIDGNVAPYTANILDIGGSYTSYEDFEVTCLGTFRRTITADANGTECNPDGSFHKLGGINHEYLKNRFVNLIVRNIPGTGIGSWKQTGDTEIYGCIIYNNGYLLHQKKTCAETAESIIGKGPGIYTQNLEASNLTRLIENNIIMGNYDAGINLWSASANIYENFLSHYKITKNIFLNNGGPQRDETSNLVINSASVTAFNHPGDIEVDKNIFYLNSRSSYVSGMLVSNSNGVHVHDNYLFKGTAGAVFRANNKNIEFDHNFFWGKYMQYSISPSQYVANSWSTHDNTYYKMTYPDGVNVMEVPDPAGTIAHFRIPLATFQSAPPAPNAYGGEAGSTILVNPFYHSTLGSDKAWPELLYFDYPQKFPGTFGSKTFVTQNKYNPNVFYVVVFDPVPTLTYGSTTFSIPVDFSYYNIPADTYYKVRDAENYFKVPLTGNLTANNISFPMHWTDFELPLGTAGTDYIVTSTSDPRHSFTDLHAFVVEFGCENVAFDLQINRTDTAVLAPDSAKNNIFVGTTTAYTANPGAVVTMKAGKQIVYKNTHIKEGANLLAKIETVCADLPLVSSDQITTTATGRSAGSTAMQDKEDDRFIIYPNPNSGLFKIENLTTATITKITVSKIDSGQLILEDSSENFVQKEFDISQYPQGLYSVNVFFDNGENISKTIIRQ